jgi:hypothetical protein
VILLPLCKHQVPEPFRGGEDPLSHAALSNNINPVLMISRAFSEVYHVVNHYIYLSADAIFSITRAAIVHALHQ